MARSARLGASMLPKLQHLASESPVLACAHGLGLLMFLEFDCEARSPAQVEVLLHAVQREAMNHGLNVGTSDGRYLTLSPPLVISEDELISALDILDRSLAAAQANSG